MRGARRRPGAAIARAREAAEGIGEVVWAGLNPAPDVPLNVPIGPHRRVFWAQSDLADLKAVKNGLGGTVNDAFLAVVAGGAGPLAAQRAGVRTEGLELRGAGAGVDPHRGRARPAGNRIAALRGPLPVYAQDPVERLRIVREAMQGVKESKQALGAEVISGLEDFAPPTLLAMASRLNFSTRLFNLIVTNVPGPQFPLYLLGREMQAIVPVAFLPEDHALAIAAMSYNGKLDLRPAGRLRRHARPGGARGPLRGSPWPSSSRQPRQAQAGGQEHQAASAREGHRGGNSKPKRSAPKRKS